MIKKMCPICETNEYSYLVYKEKLPQQKDKINFSGGKNPDGISAALQASKDIIK